MLRDIRFWIVLFFIARLIAITDPPLGSSHSWRQTTVTMIARNFLEIDNNILYPRIDIGGSGTGITGMEFPLLNYLIYLVALVFGYEHWYGRLIVLIVSCFGIWYFHRTVDRYFSQRIAFLSSVILLCSIWFSYSRMIMPDVFAMSLVLIGIFHGSVFLLEGSRKISSLILFVLFISLGSLSKLPSGYLLIVLLIPLMDQRLDLKRKFNFIAAASIAIVPSILWYFYWAPALVERWGLDHFFLGKDLLSGATELVDNAGLVFHRFYDSALKYSGSSAFMVGVIIALEQKNKLLIWILLLSSIGFAIVMLKAGFTFAHHSYYIIPFVPVMALFAGFALDRIKKPLLMYLLLVVICGEGISGQLHRFKIKPDDRALLQLEADLDKFSDRKDRIVINSGAIPTPMYFAHRKGWIEENSRISDQAFLLSLKAEGLKFVVILKRTFGSEIDLDLPIITENDHYKIYAI